MGRPFKTLTPAQIAEVETLAAILTSEQVADYLGIGRRTFYSMMARDHEIAARYKKGRARAIGSIAQTLISKARSGDTTSMIFYLKTQGGWRETVQLETFEMDRPASPVAADIDLSSLSDGALQELEAAIYGGDVRSLVAANNPVLDHEPFEGRAGPNVDDTA
ncbi:Helix-turn-helix domain-containing protein [Loktanella fryxellensis]|uniref:Helix-turn-helix domain-containing protein n=1 Tax=Loktanella fryxellensis TaxID=245187 RepID=A0A1H8IVH8_9RHOB|nr:helix-turn-helix domain-containing protein [Loktanella fryxellensis]SEN72594.1 Helix-turn-helix domain-containing protein [Loktanella fryxellensis]